MKLISANLTNFCQFRLLQVKFAPGLTAIIGKNGSGKTNLVNGIYAAVTGDFGRNDGLKAENICQYAEPGTPSKIQVVLEHGDSLIDIARNLRPVATRLKITAQGAAEQVITKTQEATEMISSIVGVSSRILADYVFVDQWSIFDFLSMMPAERAKAFQRLFRTERAEALWKLLGDHIERIVIPKPGVDKDVVTKCLAENRAQHEDHVRRIEKARRQAMAYEPARLADRIADHQRQQAIEGEIKSAKEKESSLGKTVAKIKAQIQEIEPEDNDLSDFIVSGRDAYMQARQLLGSWSTYEAIERNRQQLVTRIAECTNGLASVKAVVIERPADYIEKTDAANWTAKYNEVQHEKYRIDKLVEAIESGVVNCDVCGRPMKTVAMKLPENKLQQQNINRRLQEMKDQRKASWAFDRETQAREEQMARLEHQLTDLQVQLANLAIVPKPGKTQAELAEQVKNYDDISKAQRDTHYILNKLKQEHQGQLSMLTQLQEQIATKEAKLAILTVTDEDAAAFKKCLAEYEQLKMEIVGLESALAAHVRVIQNEEVMLEQLKTIEQQAKNLQQWADYCGDMRHLLHRDNLPRLVAQNYLELMQDEINNLLVRFGSTFSVCADETLSFVATFHDGRKVPAGRLSGGEKVLLALAFRVAVNDIFAKDLGLLILDEPTAGLDEGNLACLRIAIERLRELSTARGLQVIMITHEHDLHNLFDHVIEM